MLQWVVRWFGGRAGRAALARTAYAETLEQRRLLSLNLLGDFDNNDRFESADIDAISAAVRGNSVDLRFDLDNNGVVNSADRQVFLSSILNAPPGDATLDGTTDLSDFSALATSFGLAPSTWAQGDFNGDATTSIGDFALLAASFQVRATGGPILANRAAQLAGAFNQIVSTIDDWAGRLNLVPPPGQPTVLPVAADDLASRFGLSALLPTQVPTITRVSGVPAQLSAILAGLGLQTITMPAAPGQFDVEVRMVRNTAGLTGAAGFDDTSNPLLSGLSSSLDLDGTIAHTLGVTVDLPVGADASGFYLQGAAAITATLSAGGNVSDGYAIPLAAVSVVADGTAAVDATASLSAGAVGARLRGGQFASAFAAVDVDATANVSLDLALNRGNDRLIFGGAWTIPVVNNIIGAVSGGVTLPSVDEFVEFTLPAVTDGILHFLPVGLRDALNGISIPGVAGAPLASDGFKGRAGGGDPLFSRLFDRTTATFDFTQITDRQGKAVTDADRPLRSLELRDLTNATGAGVKIGVISDGVAGLADAVASGDLPDYLVGPQSQMFVNPAMVNFEPDGTPLAEGTAMLEIIHDMAPGAELYFSGGTLVNPGGLSAAQQFLQAVDFLINSGCDIIVDDLEFLSEPRLIDGEVALFIQSKIDAFAGNNPRDLLFVTAAGNHDRHVYSDLFRPTLVQVDPGPGSGSPANRRLHLFEPLSGTAPATPMPPVNTPSANALVTLEWDRDLPAGTTLRLLLVDASSGEIVLSSDPDTHGVRRQNLLIPTGKLATDLGSSGSFKLAVEATGSAALPDPLRFNILFDRSLHSLASTRGANVLGDYARPAGGPFGHPALTGVLSVGAADEPFLNNPPSIPTQLAGYSVRGPAFVNLQSRQVPHLVGIDGNDVTGAAGFTTPFDGTSSTAPQAAAIAALLKQLFPTTDFDVITQKMMQSARGIAGGTGGVWNPDSGFGLMDAVAAAQLLGGSGALPRIAPARGGAEASITGPRGLALLEARGFTVLDGVSTSEIASLIQGVSSAGDLFTVRYNPTLPTIKGSARFSPVNIDALGVNASFSGAVDASLAPALNLTLGIDAQGFFLNRTSTVGGTIGVGGEVAGAIGSLSVLAQPDVTLPVTVGFNTVSANPKLRLTDVVNPANLAVSLGTVHANLTLDLQLSALDYVDNNPTIPNGPRGGDPFVFRATTGLQIAQNNGFDFAFNFTGIDIQNPNFNGGSYTFANFLTNLYRFGQDKLAGSGYLGELLDALDDVIQPLSDQVGMGAAINEDLIQLVLNASNVQVLSPTSDQAFFSDLENWLRTGGSSNFEIIRAKATISNLDLVEVLTVAGDLGELLRDGNRPINLSNALLNGTMEFGIDTAGGLFVDRNNKTSLAVSMQVSANLDDQRLLGPFGAGDFLELDPGSSLAATTTARVSLGGTGKLRLRDFLVPISNVNTSVDPVVVTLTIPGADLLPRGNSSGFAARVSGIVGAAAFSGATLDQLGLGATSTQWDLFGSQLRLTSGPVAFNWDPQGPTSQTLLSIGSLAATFPGRPTFPSGTLNGLTLTGQQITLGQLSVAAPSFNASSILEVRDPTFTLTGASIAITPVGVNAVGGVGLGASAVAIFPNSSTPQLDGLVTVVNPTITLDSAGLRFTALNASFRVGDLVDVTATGTAANPISFNADATGTAHVFALPTLSVAVPRLAIDGRTPLLTFSPNGASPGLALRGDGRWDVGAVQLAFTGGGSATFGLGGFVPFEVNSIQVLFDTLPGGGANLDAFALFLSGDVNEALLAQQLSGVFGPNVTPSVTITAAPDSGGSDVALKVVVDSLSQGRIGVEVSSVQIGLDNARLGILDIDARLGIVFSPITGLPTSVTGGLGFDFGGSSLVDPISDAQAAGFDANQQGGSSSIGQISLADANLNFTGTVTSGANTVFDLSVTTSLGIRLKLADFFELYGLNFGFDFDVVSGPAGGTFNPTITGGLRTMGVRKVRANLGPAGDALVQFTGGSATADFVTLNFGGVGDIATFGPMNITLPGLNGLGGTVNDLRILRTGFPNLLPTPLAPSAQFVFTPGNIAAFFDFDPDGPGGPQPNNSEKLFSWIPIRVDALGFQLQPAMFTFDGSGNINGVNDLAAFDFIFSGGLKDSIKVNGATIPFPIHGQIDNLVLDIAALRDLLLNPLSGRSPFKDIGGVSIGVDPFSFAPDSPFKVKGRVGFGQLDTDNNGSKETLFIRVGGEFRYADFGGGAELIISNRGPLLAKVNVPLAIPLGPTGLMVSGVSGGIAFGIDSFFTPTDPMELVRNPVFTNAFDISDNGIKAALAALGPGELTWSKGLTVQLEGQLSTVVPGVVSGAVSLLANVAFNASSNEAFLFGSGQMSVWGMPIGRAGALLSLGDPLNPRYQFAMEAPAVGNPLGFILPARAEVAYDLNAQGVLEAPLTMLDAFVNSMAASELNTIAAALEQDRVLNLPTSVLPLNGTLDFSSRLRDLTRFVLDSNGDGVVSGAEFATPITGTIVKDRIRTLLPDNFSQLPTGAALVQAARVSSTFINDYLNLVIGNSQQGFDAFITNVSNAVNGAIIAGWQGFNPTLTLQALIQPTLFGFPLGNPSSAVTVAVNKTAVTFDMSASLTKIGKDIINSSTLGLGGPLATLLTLGFEDNVSFGFRLDLTPLSNLITQGLATGRNTQTNGSFADLLIDAINPFANWEVRIGGGISWMGFQLAQLDGLMFGADLPRPGWNPDLPVSSTNHPDPKPGSLFEQRVRYFNRSINSGDLQAANDDPLHIPIYGDAPANQPYLDPRWTGMLREGGILLSARLFLPSLLTDPVAVFNSIKWDQIPAVNGSNLPQTAEQFIAWIDDTVRKLTADDEFARLQMFIPSPARLFDLTTYQNNRPWLSEYSGDQQLRKVNGQFVQETFTDTNGNGRYDFGEPFVDLPNGVFDTGESFTDTGNGRWDSAEPFTDQNNNGVFDTGEKFTDLNRNGVWDPAEPKVVNSVGVITSFTDRGNGVWDDAEPFEDANGNGAYDLGERFDDFNNNGVRDLAEPFVDAGNGTYDGASGTSPTRLPRKSQAGIDAVVGQIVSAAFVDGYLDLELLGFNLGRAAVSFDSKGIRLTAEAGWLGAQLSATVRNTSHNLHDLINDFTNSPLLSVALNNLPGLQTALAAPWLPDFDLPIPVAGFQISLDSSRAAQFIADNLKIPASIFTSIGQVNAVAGIFTPGFAAGGAPAGVDPLFHAVQVDGGVYAQLKANLPGFLEDAELKLAVKIPASTGGNFPALIGAALPDFTAQATASRFAPSLAGLTLVKITGTNPAQPFGFTISKQGTALTAGLNGRIELLPDVSDFTLTANGNVTADLSLSSPKFSGNVVLSALSDFTTSTNTQFVLPRANTTFRLVVDSHAAKPVVVRISGEFRAASIFAGGQFDLSADAATVSLSADANLTVRATAGTGAGAPNIISLTGAVGFRLAPTGFAARGALAFSGGADPSLGFGFGFANSGLVEINTFATSQTINGVPIPAGRRQVSFNTDLQLGPFGFTAGATIIVDPTQATLTLSTATETLPVFGTFVFSGGITVAPGGIETPAPGILLSRTPAPGEVFGLSGTFHLFVDTLDDPGTPGNDPDVFAISVTNPTLTMLGLSLSLPTVSITGVLSPAPLFTLTITDTETGENPMSSLGIGFPSMSLTYRVLLDSNGQIRIDNGTNGTYANATFSGWAIGDANIARLSLSTISMQVVRTASGQPLRGRLKGTGLLDLPVVGQQYSLTSRLSFGDDFNLAAEAVGINGTTGTFGVYVDLERDIFSQLFDGSIWSRSNIAQSWTEMTALDPQTQPAEPKRIDISSGFIGGGTWTNDSPDLGKYAYTAATRRQAIEIPEQNDSLAMVATGLSGAQTLTVGYTISFPDGALINKANRADVRSAVTGSFILRAPTVADPNRNRASLATILNDRYFEFNENVRIDFTYTPSGFTSGELIRTTDRVDYVIINTDPELDRALVYYEFDTGTNATGPFTRSPTFVASNELLVSDWRHTSEFAFTATPGTPGVPGGPRSIDFESTQIDSVDVGSLGPTFSTNDRITVESWINVESLSGIDRFIVAGPMQLYVNGGTGQFGVTIAPASGTQFLGEFGTISIGTWTHVAVIFNQGAVTAMVNGVTVATATATFTQLSSARRVIFGTDDPSGPVANFFDGRLDEIRIWDIARTTTQIANNRAVTINPFTSGLRGYWQFDQNDDVLAVYDSTRTYNPAYRGSSGGAFSPAISTVVPTMTYAGDATVAAGTNGGLPQIQPETVPPGPTTDAVTNTRWGDNFNRTRLWFPFDQPGETTSAVNDSSPFAVNGSVVNKSTTQSQFVGGVHGSAIRFAPTPVGVKFGFNPVMVPPANSTVIEQDQDFSVAFWARTADFSPATAANEVVFFMFDNGAGFHFSIATDDVTGGLIVGYAQGTNTTYTVPLFDLPDNTWHHFFVEVDGGSGALGILRVWVDGVIRSDTNQIGTSAPFPNLGQITIGGILAASPDTFANVVNGAMDDFAILQGTRQATSEFNSADVLNIMQHGVGFAMKPLSGYQFTVGFQASSPANLRLRIDALRFFDFADATTGPTEWLLVVADAANPNTVFARVRGKTTVGEWGGQYAELRNKVFSVRGPLLFTLYALNATTGNWRVENVNVEGAVLNANQTAPIIANDDRVEARGNGVTTFDILANDTINASTTIDPDSILVALPAGVTASIANGQVQFSVDSVFAGEFDLPYLIRDAGGNEAGAIIRVRVPDLPIARDEKTGAARGSTHRVPVLLNDYDGVGTGLTIQLISFPANLFSSTSVSNNELVLNIRSDAPLGVHQYTYRITDAHGRTSQAVNDLTITASAPLPDGGTTDVPSADLTAPVAAAAPILPPRKSQIDLWSWAIEET